MPLSASCCRTFHQPQERRARVGGQRPATHTPGAGVCRGFWRFSCPSVLQGSVPHQPCLEQGVVGEGCPAGPGAGDGPQAAPLHPTAGPWRAPGTSNKVGSSPPCVFQCPDPWVLHPLPVWYLEWGSQMGTVPPTPLPARVGKEAQEVSSKLQQRGALSLADPPTAGAGGTPSLCPTPDMGVLPQPQGCLLPQGCPPKRHSAPSLPFFLFTSCSWKLHP